MTSKSLTASLAALLLAVSFSASAQDAMSPMGEDGMMPMDPMAEECFTKAHTEPT